MSHLTYRSRLARAIAGNRFAKPAIAVIAVTCLAALASYFYTPHDPAQTISSELWQLPSLKHPLGTDGTGRDSLSRLLVGSRVTVTVALGCSIGAASFAILMAALATRGPRLTRSLFNIVIDVFIAFPTLLVAIMLVAAIGNGVVTVLISFIFGGGVAVSRVIKTQLAQSLKLDYTTVATINSLPQWLIFWRHGVTSIMPIIFTQASFIAGGAVLAESSLSYLGFGVAHETVSWGQMLAATQQVVGVHPFTSFVPGAAIMCFAISCFVIGDVLRFAADPRITAKRYSLPLTVPFRLPRKPASAAAAPAERAETPASVTQTDPDAHLEVQNLQVTTAAGKKLTEPLNFAIKPGSRTAIIGASGSGKTVTALAISQLFDQNMRVTGKILLHGKPLNNLPRRERAKIRGGQIGYIFQEPKTALSPVMRISKQVTTALRTHYALNRGQAHSEALRLAVKVGLAPELLDKYPHQLSGGQRQRAAIAAALSADPRLVIADEITSALDAAVRRQIIELLLQLTADKQRTLIFITHDLAQVRDLAERVIVMHEGAIVEDQNAADFFAHPRHRVSRELLAASKLKTPSSIEDLGQVANVS